MEFRNSVRLSLLLVALTGVNVYVFFFRDDTSVKKLMQPSAMTTKPLVEQKKAAIAESAAPTALSASGSNKGKAVAALAPAPTAAPSPGAEAGGGAPLGDGRTVEGAIGPNDTLGTILNREGLGGAGGNILKALGRLIDPKSIQPGDKYAVTFSADNTPESFEYLPNPIVRYIIVPVSDGSWRGRKEEKPLTVRAEQSEGAVDSSLYESLQRAGESGALVSLLVDLFAYDINFYIDTHPGDKWKVLVEKQYLGDRFYRYGNILAAEYSGRVGTYRAFHYNPQPGRGPGRYYDDRGNALAKRFLKTPLRFVRISSKFDRKRFHPVLHKTRAHLGIDYAAPTGTPIWASSSGRVLAATMKPGSGNTVIISHGAGLSTHYYHLSRFAAGLKAGKQVQQKELIGYVGTTGLSTGPHLHFGVTKWGAFIDPTTLAPAREAPVPDRAAYLAVIRPRMQALSQGRAAAANTGSAAAARPRVAQPAVATPAAATAAVAGSLAN